jgi:hypothetical protein
LRLDLENAAFLKLHPSLPQSLRRTIASSSKSSSDIIPLTSSPNVVGLEIVPKVSIHHDDDKATERYLDEEDRQMELFGLEKKVVSIKGVHL